MLFMGAFPCFRGHFRVEAVGVGDLLMKTKLIAVKPEGIRTHFRDKITLILSTGTLQEGRFVFGERAAMENVFQHCAESSNPGGG